MALQHDAILVLSVHVDAVFLLLVLMKIFFLRLSLQRPLGQKIKECCQGSSFLLCDESLEVENGSCSKHF